MTDEVGRRILALDGGGIRGVFIASFLATLEQATGQRTSDSFDLIAGTSTGGIIAAALGAGLTAQQVVELYQELGPKVFSRKFLGRLWAAKYGDATLQKILSAALGDATLSGSRARLVIPAYNVDKRSGVLMKTPHCDDYQRDGARPLVEVALSTAAAPTYFPIARDMYGQRLIDGGMFANNPALLAVVEAVFKLGWRPNSIKVLSIGTTRARERSARVGMADGIFGWRHELIDVVMDTQSWMTQGLVSLALGAESITRIDPILDHDGYGLDDISAIPELIALGHAEGTRCVTLMAADFFGAPVEDWRAP